MTAKTTLLFFTALTATATSGFTSCQYWTTTTVPATDTVVPIAAPSVILGGDPQIIRFGILEETVHDLNMNIIAIPAVWDQNGTSRLEGEPFANITCNSTLGFSKLFPAQSEVQFGATGSTVSQGIYFLHAFRFADFAARCAPFGGIHDAQYFFNFTGFDFKGNRVDGLVTIKYTP